MARYTTHNTLIAYLFFFILITAVALAVHLVRQRRQRWHPYFYVDLPRTRSGLDTSPLLYAALTGEDVAFVAGSEDQAERVFKAATDIFSEKYSRGEEMLDAFDRIINTTKHPGRPFDWEVDAKSWQDA